MTARISARRSNQLPEGTTTLWLTPWTLGWMDGLVPFLLVFCLWLGRSTGAHDGMPFPCHNGSSSLSLSPNPPGSAFVAAESVPCGRRALHLSRRVPLGWYAPLPRQQRSNMYHADAASTRNPWTAGELLRMQINHIAPVRPTKSFLQLASETKARNLFAEPNKEAARAARGAKVVETIMPARPMPARSLTTSWIRATPAIPRMRLHLSPIPSTP